MKMAADSNLKRVTLELGITDRNGAVIYIIDS